MYSSLYYMDNEKVQVIILGKDNDLGIKVEILKYVADFNSQAQGVFENGEISKIKSQQRIRKEKLSDKKETALQLLQIKQSSESIKAKQEELERLKNILEKPAQKVKTTSNKKKKSFFNKLFDW